MDEEMANADLMVNNLIYKEPQALSLATSKTEKKCISRETNIPATVVRLWL